MTIEQLKNTLLTRNKEFSTGVVWDANEESDFKGIADNLGNFFYLESDKSFSYSFEPEISGKGGYLQSENVKLIVGVPDCNVKKAHDILLSQLIAECVRIDESDFDTERIYKDETGEDIRRKDLRLIRFNLTIENLTFPDSKGCRELCFAECC